MEIEVRTMGLRRNSWAQGIIESYLKKIKPFEKINFRSIKDDTRWLQGISQGDVVWVCDERGKAKSSRSFAKDIAQKRDGGCQKIFILLGGPFGFSEEIRQRGDQLVLLSPFVLNQEVALTVLLEQIFRAYTIINNHPYHND